jgi:phage terminase large subunit-like protein
MNAAAGAAAVSAGAIEAAAPELIKPRPDWLQALDGDPTFEWARVAWAAAARVAGSWFDGAKAEAAVALWPKVFRLTEDRFAGKPFRLNLWQAVIVRLLIGWKAPVEVLDEETGAPRFEHVRLFRRLSLWVPRKNGKSEFLAALALLFFVLDGTVGGQGFAFARDEKQAKVVFEKMKAMISLSPALGSKVRAFKKSIWVPQIRALFELLAGKAEGKHGRSPTVIVGDEMHEWTTADLAATLRQGTGARLQPIELYASTAGVRSNEVGYGLWEEAVGILEGRIDDPATLVVIFAAGPDDDWRDEAVWARANPSLGLSPTLSFLRREAGIARDNPRAEAHFRCYHLNQWIDAVVRWLNIGKWDACTQDRQGWAQRADDLKGRRCFLTFDVSATQDVTAEVLTFPPEGEEKRWKVLARFWIPEAALRTREQEKRGSFALWKAAGAIETTPGDVVDQAYLMKAIKQDLVDFDVQSIGFDPWNATKLVTDLQKDGVAPELFVEMRQGVRTLGEPTKELERLVMAGLYDHGGHPVLRWMAGNATVRFDENLNYVPAKKTSRDKIDGIVAGVMGVGLALAEKDDGDLTDFLRNPLMTA